MPVVLAHNVVITGRRTPQFLFGTNLVPFFEIGRAGSTGAWLRGEIVGPPFEPVFNGQLYLPGSSEPGVIIDTFPRGPGPNGWYRRQRVDGMGFDLMSCVDDTRIFGFELRGSACVVSTSMFDADGTPVALASDDGLQILKPPFSLGGLIVAG